MGLDLVRTTTAYRGHEIVIERDGNGCYASAPGLKGCQSQGATVDEAMVNIQEAVDLYLESLESGG